MVKTYPDFFPYFINVEYDSDYPSLGLRSWVIDNLYPVQWIEETHSQGVEIALQYYYKCSIPPTLFI